MSEGVIELSDDDSPSDDTDKPRGLLTEYFAVVEKVEKPRGRGRPKGTKNKTHGNVGKRRKTEAGPAPAAAVPQQPKHQPQQPRQSGGRGKTKTLWADPDNVVILEAAIEGWVKKSPSFGIG